MKPMITLPILVALFASSTLMAQEAEPAAEAVPASNLTPGEIELFEMLEGRVAGDPRPCLPARGQHNMTIINGTALVFDYGSTIYVNIPADARGLRDRDRLITRSTLPRLCSRDIVRTEDRFHGFYTGNIFLSDFVPYKRVATPETGASGG